MATVRLNYDGWLALPAGVRQKLRLSAGDQLELELVEGGIMLRPRLASGPPIVQRSPPTMPRLRAVR